MLDLKASEFNDVLREYENIIYFLIHKFGIRDPEGEFYQEGVIALWKAIETYNEEKGKFSTYAYFKIEKALLDLIRKHNHIKEMEENYKQFQATQKNSATLELSYDPYLLKQIKQSLSEKQLKWFNLFVLKEMSIKEIAEQENVTVDAVKNWGRLAKEKLRKLLN